MGIADHFDDLGQPGGGEIQRKHFLKWKRPAYAMKHWQAARKVAQES